MRRASLLLIVALGCTNGVGEPCAENRPCTPSLECVFPSPEAENGVCDYPLRPLGARCESGAECAAGLTCSSHFTPGERYGTCVAQRDIGEPCAVDRDCTSGVCAPAFAGSSPGRCAP